MKKLRLKRLITLSLSICMVLGTVYLFPVTSYAEYGWESAFYNDMDGDGDKELLPYIYTGTSTMTSEYYYTLSTCVPYDSEKYGGTTAEEDALWNETYDELVATYGDECEPDQRDDCYALLAAKLGEGTEAYNAAIVKYEAYWKMDDEYCQKNIAAQKLWQADQKKYKEDHPEINFGHTINDALTQTVTNTEETLLYWLHVPYDYNPEKSYPVFVLANGEWSTWNKFTYLNDDGTYKSDKFDPPDSYQMNTIMNSWYNLVKDPGENREKYDCFFIYILNTNEFFRGENSSVAIVNQYNDNAIADARTITSDDTGDTTYKGGYAHTYVADELSPGYQEQLLCQLIDGMMEEYNIDPSRQYVSGFSLGGIFTMDIISHYPDRFACAVPICTAASDITEENCKALTYTNIWAISGNNDGNCNKYHSKLFVDKINECREKYQTGLNHVAQYSFYAGGHTGGQAQCKAVTAAAGVSQTSSTHLMEFIFNSQREDMAVAEYKSTNTQVKDAVAKIMFSESLMNDTYDILLIGSDFVGDYDTKGFVCEVTYADGTNKTSLITESGSAETINATLGGKAVTVTADELDALSLYAHTITGVPKDIVKIRLTEYGQNGTGEFYGTPVTYLVSVDGTAVLYENITECDEHHYEVTTTASCDSDGIKTHKCLRCGYYYTEADEGGCIWDEDTHTCTRGSDTTIYTEDLVYSVCGKHMAVWATDSNTVVTKDDVAKVMTSAITSVEIMEGITEIGEGAFDGYSSITEVTFPSTLTGIGDKAFAGTGIEEVSIPEGVTEINGSSFEKTALKTLIVPGLTSEVTTIGGFMGFTALETVEIQRNSELTTFAFQGCSALKNLDVTGVSYCGAVAFQCCTSLTSVWLANTFTGVEETHTYTNDTGAWIFDGCYNLTDIYVEAPLTTDMLGTGTAAGWYGSIFRRYISRADGSDFGTPNTGNASQYYYSYTDLVTTIHWGCSKYGDEGAYTSTVKK